MLSMLFGLRAEANAFQKQGHDAQLNCDYVGAGRETWIVGGALNTAVNYNAFLFADASSMSRTTAFAQCVALGRGAGVVLTH